MEEKNEGVLPKPSRYEKLKPAIERYRNDHREEYNKYMNEYYHANKAKIAQQRRERRLEKQGGNDGV